MPPRWLCSLIVVCWLATNGWLFYHDIWPYLLPGQPPAFTVDLVDEIQKGRPNVLWIVSQNGREVFLGRTRVEHPTPDSFDLVAEFTAHPRREPAILSGCAITRMFSRYRVDREGRLQEVVVEIQGTPRNELVRKALLGDFTLRIQGEVQGREFRPRLDVVDLLPKPIEMPPVSVAHTGAVLLPLHPLQRIRGISPGQRWTLPVLDPVADSLGAFAGQGGGPRILAASVRPQQESFSTRQHPNALCWVIDYRGEDTNLCLWVDESTGLVLRQEAWLGSEHWVMDRD